MRVCGVDLKASDAIVVVIDGTKDNFVIVDTGVKKISLGDTHNSEDVQTFKETFHSFVKNHNIDKIGIKKRNTKGQFAGGATSFKIAKFGVKNFGSGQNLGSKIWGQIFGIDESIEMKTKCQKQRSDPFCSQNRC